VKLRRWPTTCHRRGGPAISTGSRRAQPLRHHGRLQRWLEDDAGGNLPRPHMPWAANEGTVPNLCALPDFIRSVLAALYAPDLLRRRLLTVKLRGRTTTPDRGRGPAISTGSRGPKQMTPHGPLQRWLGINQATPRSLLILNPRQSVRRRYRRARSCEIPPNCRNP